MGVCNLAVGWEGLYSSGTADMDKCSDEAESQRHPYMDALRPNYAAGEGSLPRGELSCGLIAAGYA
jgi:hypothetical protein